MPEHRIRLRAAWERIDPDGDGSPARVDLPTTWAEADRDRPIRLARRFGRPRVDDATGAVVLELADVPGLRAIRLNGRGLPVPAGDPGRVDLGGRLEARNVLELDVVPARAEGTPWGSIALVVPGQGD